jgi:type II secretory pathway pseudopilin PulG
MRQLSKPFISPSRSKQPAAGRLRASSERGIAFLILMMVLTMMLIALTVSLPDIYTQGQRAREEELLFRGDQYARAILLYHRQFNKFPQTVDDLLKRTNGYRFLRHPFRDPMTRSGKWRFIHANAAGVIIDSKTLTPPKPKKPGDSGSAAGSPGGTGSEGQEQGQENPPGETKASGGRNAPSPVPQQGTGAADNEVKGAFIVGVASTSTRKSIRIWNNKDRYDLWEFLGVATVAVPGSAGSSGTSSNTGQQGTQATGTQTSNPNPMNPQ